MDVSKLKKQQLEEVARHTQELKENPRLRWLFFEITSRCNLSCSHCGSSCTSAGEALSIEDVKNTLASLKEERPMICLTGGEPMMHPDFYEIALTVSRMGFRWGMTSNATLIDEKAAMKLKEAGMSTVSVSLDGMEECHDSLRNQKGAFRRAVEGIKALQKAGFHPQVTTVVHKNNFKDLEPLYEMLCQMNIRYWRPINVEPIGRACESKDLLLDAKQFRDLLSYIREKRFDPDCPMEVTFGCSHYLGVEEERMVRDHYFLCGAGILVAGIRSNGDICACLDVENRKDLVQGNIRTDSFPEVWKKRFEVFRRDRSADCEKCQNCKERLICGGDSTHTWDFSRNEPLWCLRDFGITG